MLGVGLALVLPLLIGPRNAHAATGTTPTPPKQLRFGTADKDPFVFTWVDNTDGSFDTDDQAADQIHDLFAGTAWLFQDDGSLVVATGTSLDNLKPIVTLHQAHTSDLTYYLVHWRAKDGSQSIDGNVIVSTQDPKKAFVQVEFVDRQTDGSTLTHHIELTLTSQ